MVTNLQSYGLSTKISYGPKYCKDCLKDLNTFVILTTPKYVLLTQNIDVSEATFNPILFMDHNSMFMILQTQRLRHLWCLWAK